MDFYNNGLSGELSADGACEKAIFPDPAPDTLISLMGEKPSTPALLKAASRRPKWVSVAVISACT